MSLVIGSASDLKWIGRLQSSIAHTIFGTCLSSNYSQDSQIIQMATALSTVKAKCRTNNKKNRKIVPQTSTITTLEEDNNEASGQGNSKLQLIPISEFAYKKRTSTCRNPKRQRCPKIAQEIARENSTLTPIRSLEDKGCGGYKILDREFFQCDALELAPRLLGKLLRKDDVILQITEVEAYRQNDTACHGRFGITARTAPVFGPGGHSYVYLCYGLHIMLNVVADKDGVGAAVLIRSCAPISGKETIQSRRGQLTNKPILLTGPGKVGQALGITTEWSNHPLYTPGGLEVLDGPAPEKILVGPRVGIEYASPEHVQALWRFAIAESAWISAPRKTLRPA